MKAKISGRGLIGLWQMMKNDLLLLYRAFRHPQVSINIKLAIVGIILYIIAPIDIIPDWIFGLGIIDDAAVIYFAIKRIKKNIPQKIKEEITGKVIVMHKK